MTSEEIIERLLDEKKISVKEALIILKDLAKIGVREIGSKIFPTKIKPEPPKQLHDIVVAYGVTPYPSYDQANSVFDYSSATTATFDGSLTKK